MVRLFAQRRRLPSDASLDEIVNSPKRLRMVAEANARNPEKRAEIRKKNEEAIQQKRKDRYKRRFSLGHPRIRPMTDDQRNRQNQRASVESTENDDSGRNGLRGAAHKTRIFGKKKMRKVAEGESIAKALYSFYENSVGYGIDKSPYKRLVKVIMQDDQVDEDEAGAVKRLQGTAGDMLQTLGESLLIDLIRDAYLITRIRDKVTLSKNDLVVARAIRRKIYRNEEE